MEGEKPQKAEQTVAAGLAAILREQLRMLRGREEYVRAMTDIIGAYDPETAEGIKRELGTRADEKAGQ